mmetsp:Transcript_41179/g.162526  ORF Transcript_41179/g.162526 Transcript_41179/m.162526 type:complete len:92 (+) Transcript_41179:1048-1323(+)
MGISLPCLCFNRLPLPGRPCPQGTKEVGGRLGGDQTSCLVNSFEGALFAALSRTLKVDKTSPPHSLNEPVGPLEELAVMMVFRICQLNAPH